MALPEPVRKSGAAPRLCAALVLEDTVVPTGGAVLDRVSDTAE